jgi:hypothetical protein
LKFFVYGGHEVIQLLPDSLVVINLSFWQDIGFHTMEKGEGAPITGIKRINGFSLGEEGLRGETAGISSPSTMVSNT